MRNPQGSAAAIFSKRLAVFEVRCRRTHRRAVLAPNPYRRQAQTSPPYVAETARGARETRGTELDAIAKNHHARIFFASSPEVGDLMPPLHDLGCGSSGGVPRGAGLGRVRPE